MPENEINKVKIKLHGTRIKIFQYEGATYTNKKFSDLSKRDDIILVELAYIVCFTNELLQKELKYLVKVFHETNNYPHYVIKQILK